MRTPSKHAMGGFAAGLVAMIALGSMLGLKRPGDEGAAKRDPRFEAILNQIAQFEDQLAASEVQVTFWQQELAVQDGEVQRFMADAASNPTSLYFLDRTKGLANRAANAQLDARLSRMINARRLERLRDSLSAP